jgi:uncharacterized protein YoxC
MTEKYSTEELTKELSKIREEFYTLFLKKMDDLHQTLQQVAQSIAVQENEIKHMNEDIQSFHDWKKNTDNKINALDYRGSKKMADVVITIVGNSISGIIGGGIVLFLKN